MSTPELAIAKVNFSAVLFRKDPTPLTRPEIESFHALLADAIARCSPANVQVCKPSQTPRRHAPQTKTQRSPYRPASRLKPLFCSPAT
jgi:hypothetical protein